MSTKRQRIDVRGMPVEVVRKDIKNLHVGVYPPSGRVRVAAPRRLDDEAVRLAVISRLAWIRRQQVRFEQQVRNASARRIWLNLELAKKPAACLEYILVHEMAHILERHHNERFCELMDALMPAWRVRREELNKAPLAHEEWRY